MWKRVEARLREPVRPLAIYATAAAIGLLTYVLVYGPRHLIGATPYWELPFQDERQALIGYRYFLHEPWHWPVFVSDAINVPYPKSVAFLDCVPLWALVNKAIATIVPPWRAFSAHAYLGLWHAVVYMLQACLGVANLRALGHRSWRTGIVTAVFFVAIPTWIFRYPHPGLSAHWIELWALYLYLRTPPGRPGTRSLGLVKLAQLAVAALVYPYHAVISLAVFFASLVRTRDLRTAAVWLPLGVAVVLAMTWFVGYFAPETAVPQWGFEHESANMLGWLVPERSGIIGDARWIANVMGTPWQYEGYAYLGLGCLALLVMFVPHARSLRAVIARHPMLFAIAVGFSILALSNHVYVGSHEVLSYPIPWFLRWIPQQFRSPGRFVWLPTYVLIVFLLHWGFTRFRAGRRFLVIVAVALVQVLDARGDRALQRAQTAGPSGVILDAASWRPLVAAHDAVEILPPYTCVTGDDAPLLDHVSMDIQMLASEHVLPINGVYCARPLRHCAEEERAWATLQPAPGTLYVLLPQARAVADVLAAGGARCATFAYGRVCSTRETAIADAIRAGILQPPPAPITLAPGEKLELASVPALETGWSAAEPAGRWIDSSLASLLLRVDGAPPAALAVQADAELCGARQSQDVDVLIDGAPAGTLHFAPGANDPAAVRTIAIPARDRLRGPIAVELRPRDRRAPAELGCRRAFGVRVARVWFP